MRARTVIAVVAAVLVVVLLLLVVILPSLSTSSGSPGSGGGLASEQTAAAIAGSFTNRLAGGPWQLVDAFGSLTTTETVVSISNLFPSNASCPLLDQTVASVELAPFNGTYESGLAEAWVFLYWASGVGGNSALGIFVQSGSAVELGEESGAGCYITTPLTLGTDLIDSTAAAQAAVATASGSTFIAAVHHANATYSLEPVSYTSGGSSKTASLWYVLFSGKAGSATRTFGAELYANNGTVLCTTGYKLPCVSLVTPVPIGSAFSAGAPVSSICPAAYTYAANGCKAADYIYTLTVETTGATFGSVLFEVKTSSGAIDVAASVGGFSVMTISSVVAAQMTTASTTLGMTATFGTYGGAGVCNGATCSASTPWSSIYTIIIDMGTGNPVGTGLSFEAIGTAGYSGTTSLSLP